MRKTSYRKELTIAAPQRRHGTGNTRRDVEKIQAWLALYEMRHPGSGTFTTVDGAFGPATELAVKNFQRHENLPVTGVVDQAVFERLRRPLESAFQTDGPVTSLRESVTQLARQHLESQPLELVIHNRANAGPWVRSYMDGHEGEAWFWCMGFVQTILDQAASAQGKDFRVIMPHTYGCDAVGTVGLRQGLLMRYTEVRKNPSQVKPGDLFLLQKSANDWTHTGLILSVGDGTFDTIEGNTNMGGSRNGNGVYRRVRNFEQAKLDVFSIEPLV